MGRNAVITSTKDRLTIAEPTAELSAIAMAEGGVALRIGVEAAFLDRDEAITLMAWLSEATA